MKLIIMIRNRIDELYRKYPRISGYVGRLVFAVICFFLIRDNCGYNTMLSNTWFILGLSVFCAFAPTRYLMLIIIVYMMVQMFSLSMGVGVICSAVLLIIYLIYFRFDPRYMYLMLLMPLFALAKLPLLIPLALAATASVDTLAVVIFGNVIYYMIRYINVNAAVISGMTEESEYTKMIFTVNGIFTYTEFLYMIIITVIIFLLVFYLRKMNINQANTMAIVIGCGAYIILGIIANLVFGTITAAKLTSIVLGSIVSAILAAFAAYVILPLDYNRLETFEFEDDEYHYYVRAVPKAMIRNESVRVKRINARKEVSTKNVEEEDQ